MNKAQKPVTDINEIEKRTEFWNNNDTGMELHEFLGWTRDQMAKFNENGEIPDGSLKKLND